ncbi:hypothetical protein, partial [Shewanella algae]|uniref:NADH-quinone oxidoreductase subunit J family protein n=1 Tax=Shewanella algae TaxID=38313 RepID=UPI00313CEFBF
LFLFVIMFLGVDRRERFMREPFRGQKPLAAILGLLTLAEILVLSRVGNWSTGQHATAGALNSATQNNIRLLGQSI